MELVSGADIWIDGIVNPASFWVAVVVTRNNNKDNVGLFEFNRVNKQGMETVTVSYLCFSHCVWGIIFIMIINETQSPVVKCIDCSTEFNRSEILERLKECFPITHTQMVRCDAWCIPCYLEMHAEKGYEINLRVDDFDYKDFAIEGMYK